MDATLRTRFLTNTDETGRFIVYSMRTGRTYFVEPIETEHTPKWGSIDPATGNLMHKKGDGKYKGGIRPDESLITVENGFAPDKITMLDRGTSPHNAIDVLDAKYPDKPLLDQALDAAHKLEAQVDEIGRLLEANARL